MTDMRRRVAMLAAAVLLTSPGKPYVYQGEDLPSEEAEAKKAEAESPCTEEQLEKVLALYTEDEMTKMLKRMKKSAPAEITREEAEKMIRKRDMSLVTAKVDSF